MNCTIDQQLFTQFPSLNIGILVVRGIDNAGTSEEVAQLLREQETRIKAQHNLETLSEQPQIHAWREAYRWFGAKPKKYRCSVENLYRMVLEDVELRHINKLVDIYNVMSLKHMVPVGGDDLDKIDGGLTLTVATGDEPFTQLNAEKTTHPKEGEVVYRDDKEVLCRRWNWRECDKSKMTEQTTNALLVVEALPPTTEQDLQTAIQDLQSLAQQYCGGTSEIHILNSATPSCAI